MLGRFETGLVSINRWAILLMLAVMSCIVFANVLLRYLVDDSLIWAEEVARFLMIWVTFLGAGLVLRFGGHIAVDELQTRLPRQAAQAVRVFLFFVLMAFFGLMAWWGGVYAYATRNHLTPVTGIPYMWVYLASPIGFLLMIVHLAFIGKSYVSDGSFEESDEMDAEAAAAL